MMSKRALSMTTSPPQGDSILHFPLAGELKGFTLAAHQQLRTVALLYSLRGEPSMLCEQQFEGGEFALLLRLLSAYPHPLSAIDGEDEDGQVFAALYGGEFWQKVVALSCEVVVQGGYALRAKNCFNAVLPEIADELYLVSAARALAAGTTLVANQRLCTVALLRQDPAAGARLEGEYALSPQQVAILLAVLNGDLEPVLQRDAYNELVHASSLYGSRWMEREGNLDHSLEQRYPALPREEQERAEQLVWQVFVSLRPILELLGLSVRREQSYYLTPARGQQDAPGRVQ
jgi:hypothetical protein